ncbi:DNA gyrase B family protein [Babesia bovis T2Bo]|uniref:DNA topoisomerase 2 n=1 Tax=Babesia bovis TaxID=5865 RepID=A7ASL8_BABBO|nr:DNA gyrase B family protein [Babesia bovis T2Bo]EDO07537.1 DNA gyrase B family protein [Babesia bovis T2Bo]|eukprot:XP_001611105.1 DNA gyrase subunit B [Babesia bovis T2Bo]
MTGISRLTATGRWIQVVLQWCIILLLYEALYALAVTTRTVPNGSKPTLSILSSDSAITGTRPYKGFVFNDARGYYPETGRVSRSKTANIKSRGLRTYSTTEESLEEDLINETDESVVPDNTELEAASSVNQEYVELQDGPEVPRPRLSEYSTDDIVVLQGLEAVRKRPGMYIGNTTETGLHQLLFEILDNSVDEYLAGCCNKITVTLRADGSAEISDNGRGIPCDVSEKTGKSGLETVLTVLHSGGKFNDTTSKPTPEDQVDEFYDTHISRKFRSQHVRGLRKRLKDASSNPYEYASGLHGVGLSVVNALSAWLRADVYKGTKQYSIQLSRGMVTEPLSVSKCAKRTGTTISFMPDYDHVFIAHHDHQVDTECPGCASAFNHDTVRNRIEELSYVNPMLTLRLVDERLVNEDGSFHEETFMHKGGTREFLQDIIKDRVPLYKSANIINIRGKSGGVEVEVSLSWAAETYAAQLKGFANNVSTSAGTHIEGFKAAITKAVNHACRRAGLFKHKAPSISGEFIREGLTAIISVKLMGAEFDGQTKSKLGNQIARTAVERIVSYQMNEILEKHPQLLTAIYNKSIAAKRAFEVAKHAKELVRQKNANFLTTGLPAKLSDCTSNDIGLTELFIVEGESAAGNAKQARNRRFQAVLPLKGKILNIEKISSDLKVMENEEIKLLISSIGLAVNPQTWRQDTLSHVENMVPTSTRDALVATGPVGTTVDTTEASSSDSVDNNNVTATDNLGNIPVDASSLAQLPLRYGKIILLTDADVDGAHLRILLLGLLFRICPQLYEHGRVYIACPPLYRITNMRKGNKARNGPNASAYTYAWSEEELPIAINKEMAPYNLDSVPSEDIADTEQTPEIKPDSMRGITVQRFKGLGEMMAQQLWDTTMNPDKRILRRISVQDGMRASKMLELLMGGDVQSRKEFIFTHADAFQLHDLDR